jgi:hypothetical protein
MLKKGGKGVGSAWIIISFAIIQPTIHFIFYCFQKLLIICLFNISLVQHAFIKLLNACRSAFYCTRCGPHTLADKEVSKNPSTIKYNALITPGLVPWFSAGLQ